jgi:formylglycine-generating enzyme required for sulfatase activity
VYLSDVYQRYQPNDPVISTGGTERAFRGGSWLYPAVAMTVFNRDHAAPDFQFSHLGFRLIY